MRISDWSSDVCSSDLLLLLVPEDQRQATQRVPGSGSFLGLLHRRKRSVLPDALPGDERNAQAYPGLHWCLRVLETDRLPWYVIMAAGLVIFFINLFWSLMAGRKAEANPWGEGATTLAWTLSSTPPFHRSEEHTCELQSLMRISYAV